jgi:hypothetical protein
MSTEKVDLKTKYKAAFDKLFSRSEPLFPQRERGYAMPRYLEEDAILFIGLNPSFDETKQYEEWYSLTQDEGGYFAKFRAVGGDKYKWTHLDLLAVRETKQQNVEALESTNIQFLWDNLQLSKDILEASKPKTIVVVNTLARKYLGKDKVEISKKNEIEEYNVWLGYDFGEIDEDGTYRIQNSSKLKNVPVFFSGMLTGQRALDNGSYERLQWHVHKVLSALV